MITLEDYMLSYSEYLANKEYQERAAQTEIKAVTESSVLLEADMKANIDKYVKKVIEGIQKVWDKFKDNVNKAKLDWKDDEIQKAINTDKIEVSVKDYVNYDTDHVSNLNIQTLNTATYNASKDAFKDEESFMTKFYPDIYSKNGNNISEKFQNYCIKGKEDTHQVTKDDLQSMYTYMKSNKDLLDKMGKNLDQVNQAAKNADLIAGIVSGQTAGEGNPTTPTGGNAGTATAESYGYFSEADEKENQVVSTADTATNNAGNGDANKGNDAQKDIQVYFKCTSQLISAQMKTSREIYHLYDTIISTHMKNVTAANKNNKQEEAPANNATGGTAQVNV